MRFKNQGLDSIEVQDNGSGITSDNYQSIALKHYTSKLSVYDDLSDLQTFGFRGEALSSLSALSHLSIITCVADDAPKGSKLQFASSGALESTSIVPAKQGTTVIVDSLFHNLPVRRRELERHIKREWAKVISLLNQYACILTGIKFTVSQQPTKGKKIVLFSTKGNPTTRENIVNIFGAKTMTALIPLDLVLEMEPTKSQTLSRRSKGTPASHYVIVKGFVSRPAHGEGRQAPDRQMFFVNGRPCGLPQFAKVFNEVYKAFNSTQSPFILADIQLDTHLYDVNVSPDKRTILLHEQGSMLEHLKESLNSLFEAQDYTVPVSQLATQKTLSLARASATTPSSSKRAIGDESSITTPEPYRLRSDPELHNPTIVSEIEGTSLATRGSIKELFMSSRSSQATSVEDSPVPDNKAETPSKAPAGLEDALKPEPPDNESSGSESLTSRPGNLNEAGTASPRGHPSPEPDAELSEQPEREADQRAQAGPPYSSDFPVNSTAANSQHHSRKRMTLDIAPANSLIGPPSSKRHRIDSTTVPAPSLGSVPKHRTATPSAVPSFGGRLSQLFSATARSGTDSSQLLGALGTATRNIVVEEEPEEESGFGADPIATVVNEDEHDEADADTRASETAMDDAVDLGIEGSPERMILDGEPSIERDESPPVVAETRQTRPITTRNVGRRKDATLQYQQSLHLDAESLGARVAAWSGCFSEAPRSASTTPNEESDLGTNDAEQKLTLTISKGDFNKMKIVGQFNLGFILAVRPAGEGDENAAERRDELFIIDQHASDEKYNFERLQSSTVVESQRLVHPKTLDLTALEEEIVLNNLQALEANGFKVTIDVSGDSPVGARCQLLALPLSKETTFTIADLEELISLLGDSHATSDTTAVPRPSKVRKMFAMRACRSSIMIGNPLQHRKMEKVVRHMGELDKPWNCPHGRPTMRHLCSMDAWDNRRWVGDCGPATSGLDLSWADYVGE